MSAGLSVPRSHSYNTCQCTVVGTAMPSVVSLLLLWEGIIGEVKKRNKYRQTVVAAGAAY